MRDATQSKATLNEKLPYYLLIIINVKEMRLKGLFVSKTIEPIKKTISPARPGLQIRRGLS